MSTLRVILARKKTTAFLAVGAMLLALVAGVSTGQIGPPRVSKAAIQSSVTRDPALLARAWAMPVAAAFRPSLVYQSGGSRCGPASLANVFRSLGDARATETLVLDGTGRCWSGTCIMGLSLDELSEVARAHTQHKISVLRDLTPDQFREHLRRSNDPGRRYVINFSRKPIFGAGGGHHSPIGGYLEAEDLVFVLDVNADFQPWLVERERLFAAVDTIDGGQKRGMLLIE